jgi:hypothetical protein
MLGRFLELSLPAPRILESWEWYRRVGFVPATDREVWRHRSAVLTDGRIALGLHEEGLEEPLLTWVLPGLATAVRRLTDDGIEFESLVLGDEAFHEVRLRAPDGHGGRLVEARTFSMPSEPVPAPLGWFEEVALPVRNLGAARDWWERAGFVAVGEGESPWPWVTLTSDTLNLALHETTLLAGAMPVFACEDPAALDARLAAAGIEPVARLPRALDGAQHRWLRAPEGTLLWVAPPAA